MLKRVIDKLFIWGFPDACMHSTCGLLGVQSISVPCGDLPMRTAQARQEKGTLLTVRYSFMRLVQQHDQDQE